jgi:hypothetical protein
MVRPLHLIVAFPALPTFIVLYGLVPLLTITTFVILCRSVSVRSGPPALEAYLFLLVSCCGGVVFVGLTALSGHWFGLASIATFFLLFASPFIFIPVTVGLWRMARRIRTARVALYACFVYYIVIITALVLFIGPWGKQ